jgi:OmpA-OmpF porin, OOP family
MTSFLDEAASLISPELLGRAATAFGVPADGVQRAMGAALPTVLGSIAGKANDAGFMGDLFQMVTNPATSGGAGALALNAVQSLAGGGGSPMLDMSRKLLGGLFGNSGDAVSSAIGRMAGLGTSGSGIMSTVATLAMGMLGNRVRSGGLSIGSLASSLLGEKDALMRAIPAPIAGLLSMGSPAPAPRPVERDRAAAAVPAPVYGGISGTRIFTMSMGVVGAALLFWWGAQQRKPKPEMPSAMAELPAMAPEPAPLAPGLELLSLPNGTGIQVSPSGIERQMVAFITDSTRAIDKTTWFDFDRLLFETGSAVLQPSSLDQLSNINEIMRAFPAVKLKLGGYTDNVGQSAANMKLSTDRANTAMAELVKLGVAADRLEAEGYGDTVPVADNSTEEGRAKNRRTAARVTAK